MTPQYNIHYRIVGKFSEACDLGIFWGSSQKTLYLRDVLLAIHCQLNANVKKASILPISDHQFSHYAVHVLVYTTSPSCVHFLCM